MEHKSYSKLYNLGTQNAHKQLLLQEEGTLYNITEKIHGANFCYVLQFLNRKIDLAIASRNQFTTPDFQGGAEVYKTVSKLILDWAVDYFGPTKATFYFYGELYGNGVITGVQYGDKDFRLFDVYEMHNERWLKLSEMEKLAKDIGLKTVPILARNLSFTECTEYNQDFETTINTTENPIENNKSEGIVIKSDTESNRAVIKYKNALNNSKRTRVKQGIVPEILKSLYDELIKRVTMDKLTSILSKEDIKSIEDFGEVLRMFSCETLAHAVYPQESNKAEQKTLSRQITKDCSIIVREYFSLVE